MNSQTKIELRIKNKELRKRVFVGLSGGVDSSVSAALLKKQGFDVTGVFIKTWAPDWLECTWKEERLDAMRICAKLDILFFTLDLEKEYKRDVVDYMIAEYKAGRTPNPDVMCNKYIKFGGFFDWAMKQGADYVATGHYARIREFPISNPSIYSGQVLQFPKKSKIQNSKLPTTNYFLLTGADANKDQSYFLWTLTQKQLSKTLFPIGHLEKPEVRKLAKKFGLFTAEKKDSQGLCFMGKVDVKDFLAHYIKPKRGKVLLASEDLSRAESREIGHHDGAVFLTIGERHGFMVTKKTTQDKPYFIVAKDIKKNTITVANKLSNGVLPIATREFRLKNINIFGSELSKDNLTARVRYRQPLQELTTYNLQLTTKSEVIVKFKEPQTVASGQSVVLYRGDECLGGGVIS